MGKTARWFRSLLGGKKQSSDSSASVGLDPKEKNKRASARSTNNNGRSFIGGKSVSIEVPSSSTVTTITTAGTLIEGLDPSKHAIAVAAATAAVAEAAIAAAQAAAEVVRLTSSGSRATTPHTVGGSDRRRELAAVKIQSTFRAYLARRALRALKALVKLQALVRGHIVRKQSANMLRRMQAMVRIQARACATRAFTSESAHFSSKSFQFSHPGIATPMKHDRQPRSYNSKFDGHVLERCSSKPNVKHSAILERMQMNSNWLDRWMEETTWNSQRDLLLRNRCADDEKADKILEIDTWKPHLGSKRNEIAFQSSQGLTAWQHNEQAYTTLASLPRNLTKLGKPNPSLLSEEAPSPRSIKLPLQMDQGAVWTTENGPQVNSGHSRPGSSGRRGPFTPARSECSQSLFGDYLSHPNYMTNTESSRAKIRSQSAPRQRIQPEKPFSTLRFIHGIWDADTCSERGSSRNPSFRGKAYPGSGHLDRPGMPSQDEAVRYGSTYGGRY